MVEPGLWDAPELTRLERIALDADLLPSELRDYLRREIARTTGWKTPRTLVKCSSCGSEFELSSRRARAHTVEGSQPRCPLCSRDLTPGQREINWLASLPPEVLENAVAAMSVFAA